MDPLLEQIERGTLWQFPGGIHPPEQKFLSNQLPIARLPLPEKIVLPLKQHIGANGQLLVNIGDHVLKGQPLTKPSGNWSLPVHAPTSGQVIEIKPMPSAHPSALPELSVIITPDGNDTWCDLSPVEDISTLSHQQLVDILHNAGIAGMGGAGFPTYVKADSQQPIEYLVVNGVECEPYITADDLLMREHAQEIVQGIEIMQQLLQPKLVLIGIEDNKPEAIAAMQQACAHNNALLVRSVPTKYPSGGEKQLIRILTSKEVPSAGIPADIGVLVQNVGTLFAISEAILKGKPLIERVVTVTGNTISQKQNVWALIGTEIKHLLDSQGFTPVAEQRVVMGGPMMGFTLPTVRIPVVKTTNCILAPDSQELAEPGEEKACIRCSACADACPQTLLPQQLQWFAKSKEFDKLEEYNLFDCIECGACSYVCPSEIPLVQYYRVAKAQIREQKLDQIKAERAKERFEARKERLEKEQEERQNKHKRSPSRAAKPDEEKAKVADALARVKQKQGDKSAVQAAIERAKAKKAADGSLEPDNSEVALERAKRKEQARQYKEQKQTSDDPAVDKKDAVAQAIARAKAKKAAQAEGNIEQPATSDGTQDSKKAAVAVAIARAKAKKAASQSESVPDGSEQAKNQDADSAEDPRKAAVAAAIARAKAKKAAQQAEQVSEQTEPVEAQDTETSDDPRKAAVAAAIARAKAKKAAQQAEQVSEQTEPVEAQDTETSDDPRKAAVAAAIARAKAKKAAKQAEQVADEPEQITEQDADTSDDPRKAAVAAAIARAKAKKAAQQAEQAVEQTEPVEEQETETSDDPRKAAVAAAIARAKAKKAAKQAEQDSEQDGQSEPDTSQTGEPKTPSELTPEQKKQAAIKAAIAKAKAKKQAKEQEGNDPS